LASTVTYQFPARGSDVQSNNYHVKSLAGANAGGVEMPPVKVIWYDGGLRPPRPESLEDKVKMGTNGRMLIGDKGFILGNTIYPEAQRKEVGAVAKLIPRVANHYGEWAEACKGGLPAGANFDWAGPLAEAVLLGNVALRSELREEMTAKKLLWDSAALRFTNFDDANQFLRREYRAGWVL
jgi:hypothetical protein